MVMDVTEPPEVVMAAVADAPVPAPVSENDNSWGRGVAGAKGIQTTLWITRVDVASFTRALTGEPAGPSRMITDGADE